VAMFLGDSHAYADESMPPKTAQHEILIGPTERPAAPVINFRLKTPLPFGEGLGEGSNWTETIDLSSVCLHCEK